jgi:hypothetical protein
MHESEHDAQPSRGCTIYLLDRAGLVIGWPLSSAVTNEDRRRADWHVSRFYTPEGRVGGAPERDLRMASESGLEMHAWRIREDGSTFWAHVTMKPLHDEKRQLLGFVLVHDDLADGAGQLPSSGRDSASRQPLDSDRAADQLRDQLRALESVMGSHAGDMPQSVRAMLLVIAKQLEHLCECISNHAVLAPGTNIYPSKFDRRRK